jgi:TRAP-type C4-dicarboxylate transport system permease large subunit
MERVPEAVAAGFLSVSDNPHIILLLILILMLIVGMFMDIAAALSSQQFRDRPNPFWNYHGAFP